MQQWARTHDADPKWPQALACTSRRRAASAAIKVGTNTPPRRKSRRRRRTSARAPDCAFCLCAPIRTQEPPQGQMTQRHPRAHCPDGQARTRAASPPGHQGWLATDLQVRLPRFSLAARRRWCLTDAIRDCRTRSCDHSRSVSAETEMGQLCQVPRSFENCAGKVLRYRSRGPGFVWFCHLAA